MSVQQISAIELQAKLQQDDDKFFLLDVREPLEYAIAQIKGSNLIPLGQIQQRINELDPQRRIVVICHHGIRSQQAADFLVYSGFANVFNLVGGIDAWSCLCDPEVPRY